MFMDKNVEKTVEFLKTKKKVLFLLTSNRWVGEKGGETPKSSLLAQKIAKDAKNVEIIDVSKLIIYPCEGNVSSETGNSCGLKESVLQDSEKNPSKNHRCWASINNKDDELWKISKRLFESECVVFFSSVRWGQTNSIYQKLIERLTWIENRHSTLGEENIIKNIFAGIILTGHNWRGKKVLETQKQVLDYFGFKVENDLCWEWHYTGDDGDESSKSYIEATKEFEKTFLE
jgi:multimeric flavodoxin WrbA